MQHAIDSSHIPLAKSIPLGLVCTSDQSSLTNERETTAGTLAFAKIKKQPTKTIARGMHEPAQS